MQYAISCSGTAAYRSDCEQLKDGMEQAEDAINVLLHLPFIYYVQGWGPFFFVAPVGPRRAKKIGKYCRLVSSSGAHEATPAAGMRDVSELSKSHIDNQDPCFLR